LEKTTLSPGSKRGRQKKRERNPKEGAKKKKKTTKETQIANDAKGGLCLYIKQ